MWFIRSKADALCSKVFAIVTESRVVLQWCAICNVHCITVVHDRDRIVLYLYITEKELSVRRTSIATIQHTHTHTCTSVSQQFMSFALHLNLIFPLKKPIHISIIICGLIATTFTIHQTLVQDSRPNDAYLCPIGYRVLSNMHNHNNIIDLPRW